MVRPYRFSLEGFFKLPLPERGVELLKGEPCQGIPEVWVADLPGHRLLVGRGERMAPLAFPQTLLEIPW